MNIGEFKTFLYVREKLRIAELVNWDKAAYSLAKGPFIESIPERYARSQVSEHEDEKA